MTRTGPASHPTTQQPEQRHFDSENPRLVNTVWSSIRVGRSAPRTYRRSSPAASDRPTPHPTPRRRRGTPPTSSRPIPGALRTLAGKQHGQTARTGRPGHSPACRSPAASGADPAESSSGPAGQDRRRFERRAGYRAGTATSTDPGSGRPRRGPPTGRPAPEPRFSPGGDQPGHPAAAPPGSAIGATASPNGPSSGACSRMTCALVPLMPKEDTRPGGAGRPGQGRARSAAHPARRSSRSAGSARRRAGSRGSDACGSPAPS